MFHALISDIPRRWWVMLTALVTVDFCLAAAHMAWGLVPDGMTVTDSPWNLSTEGGVGEWYEHLKLALCAFGMAALLRYTGAAVFGLFAAIYTLALADDKFQLHEWIGDKLHMIGPDHVAQLVVYLITGLSLLVCTVLVISRTTSRLKADSQAIFALFELLAFFSVGMDAFHIANIVEEGGEIAALSLHLAFIAFLVAKHRVPKARDVEGTSGEAPASTS